MEHGRPPHRMGAPLPPPPPAPPPRVCRYHSHHHASFVTEAITGSVHPFLEHVAYTANFAIPLLGAWAMGGASWAMFYSYLLVPPPPPPPPPPFPPPNLGRCHPLSHRTVPVWRCDYPLAAPVPYRSIWLARRSLFSRVAGDEVRGL